MITLNMIFGILFMLVGLILLGVGRFGPVSVQAKCKWIGWVLLALGAGFVVYTVWYLRWLIAAAVVLIGIVGIGYFLLRGRKKE